MSEPRARGKEVRILSFEVCFSPHHRVRSVRGVKAGETHAKNVEVEKT